MYFRQLARFLLRKAKLLFAFLVAVPTTYMGIPGQVIRNRYSLLRARPSNNQILAMNGVCGVDGTRRLCYPGGLSFCWFKRCPPVIFERLRDS